jgi:hypothetical protein
MSTITHIENVCISNVCTKVITLFGMSEVAVTETLAPISGRLMTIGFAMLALRRPYR